LQHLNDPVPPLLDERPDLDGDLCAWVERMLAKDPESRPASAADAWDELDDLVLGSLGPRRRRESRLGEPDAAAPTAATAATMARSDQPIAPQGPPRRRRGRVVALAALGLTLLAVGVGSAVAVYGDDGKPGPQQAETTQSTSGPAQHTIGLEHGPVLTALKLDSQRRGATATLLLSGPPLRARSVRIGDDTVRDGHAWFELKQPGIEARVRRRAHGALAVRVRKGRSLVRVDVAASPGAYDSLRVRRPNGHRVLIVLTTTPRASTSHASSSPTYSPPSSPATTTTTTTTTTPTKP